MPTTPSRRTRQLAAAFATIRNFLPGRYDRLEALLSQQPIEVQLEFHRLVQNLETELHAVRRRAQCEPWRR
jgi:hypothetical protein